MNKINVNVVYAESVKDIWQKQLQLEHNSNVINAIEKSGFFDAFPYFSYNNIQFGVYGLVVDADTLLKDKDRIEIYREYEENFHAIRSFIEKNKFEFYDIRRLDLRINGKSFNVDIREID